MATTAGWRVERLCGFCFRGLHVLILRLDELDEGCVLNTNVRLRRIASTKVQQVDVTKDIGTVAFWGHLAEEISEVEV
jgi:hypothetical protein